MVEIEDKLVSQDLFEKKFVCDLTACKGACCIEGDGGAPLEEQEIELLEKYFDHVEPYLSEKSLDVIKKSGYFVVGEDGELETPLVNGKECVYVHFDKNGVAKCAFDTAHREGKIPWKKPISCHLYPIRISKLSTHKAINFHEWQICKPACECGDKLNVQVFKFLKEPIIRKFGKEFYEELERVNEFLQSKD